jgi:hypothetical protein
MFEFYDFFVKHRIYLSERVCRSLAAFMFLLREPVVAVHVSGGIDHPNPQTLKRNEAFRAAYQAFEKEVPEALKALEDEFRSIVGVESSRSVGA